jgi:hypothetical protein
MVHLPRRFQAKIKLNCVALFEVENGRNCMKIEFCIPFLYAIGRFTYSAHNR